MLRSAQVRDNDASGPASDEALTAGVVISFSRPTNPRTCLRTCSLTTVALSELFPGSIISSLEVIYRSTSLCMFLRRVLVHQQYEMFHELKPLGSTPSNPRQSGLHFPPYMARFQRYQPPPSLCHIADDPVWSQHTSWGGECRLPYDHLQSVLRQGC